MPRVKMTTSKGEVVIELFENEAPDTVGNFVSLVEVGFYDNKKFHRVLKNFVAQTGCPKGDGTGDAGYSIYCECAKADYRKHFRGSLSMAHAGPDTGGSQFFITFRATP
ncbi:MAG: peptidylprolyl isomerase, partial [Planctomycetaceae bacterium]|nr:peptidylprolyl isomerase [Planctomycetaceae bacterium]